MKIYIFWEFQAKEIMGDAKTLPCLRWNQENVVHYKLLEPEETANTVNER